MARFGLQNTASEFSLCAWKGPELVTIGEYVFLAEGLTVGFANG